MASMMAYVHINLLSMLHRFATKEAVVLAIDSIYINSAKVAMNNVPPV